MEVFGMLGMSLGTMGFLFGLIAFVQTQKLTKTLKEKGILLSQPGKGYYIDSIEINTTEKVFVLFDELNAFKEDLYNSFLTSLNAKAQQQLRHR